MRPGSRWSRAALLLAVAQVLAGCVNLPAPLRDELRCAAPDNFGNAVCATPR
jgi:hypothetical protein